MEKSIESIWKEGFMKGESLVIPKLNNLYNQKSRLLIDRFLRIMKIDLWTLIPITLIISAWILYEGQLWVGISYLLISAIMFVVAWKKLQEIENIDQNINCYQYLKSVDQWIERAKGFYIRMIRYGTPIYLIIVLILSFATTQEKSLQEIVAQSGIGEIVLLLMAPFAASLIAVGFYKLMYRIVYGHIIKKIREMLDDMEELKSS